LPSPQVYLLIGKERSLKREFLSDLRKRLFPKDSDSGMNAQEFIAGEDNLGAALDFALTTPFLSDKRLAILWDIEELEDEEKTALLASVEKLPSSGVLVLISEETGVKKIIF